MSKKVLIIGGVAGGASAAARLRRLDEQAEIILFEKGPHISFANCGLPYYIGGSITERERLLVQTPQGITDRFRIDVRTESEVISIDPAARTVTVNSQERGQYMETYDELLLSPGARPIIPNVPGADHPLLYTVRNVKDIDRVKEQVQRIDGGSAIVVGGGFIGVEMAENLREAGLDVTLIEGNPQLLAPFDPELAAVLAEEMQHNGVKLVFSQRVQGFTSSAHGIGVQLQDNMMLEANMVILAIGVTPDTVFLQGTDIALGARGHIIVNEAMQTNIPHIYAVGDAIEVHDLVLGTPAAIPLAGPANKQGRIAADQIAGIPSTYKGTQGTSIIKVFGLTGASTGSNEKTLQRHNIRYQSVIVHPSSHASYYPGASSMMLKLLFAPDGRILGAQAVGYEGVDKRIDDIAVAIRFGGNVSDLTELELSYAPPYSSAKDPVNIAGYAADNILAGRTAVFTYDQIAQYDPAQQQLLDVRSSLEHGNGHIPGSLSIPVDELRDRLHELDQNKELLVYCQVGLRGYTASRILAQHGYQVKNLSGGYKTYKQAQFKPMNPFSSSNEHTQSGQAIGSATHSNVPKTDQIAVDTVGHSLLTVTPSSTSTLADRSFTVAPPQQNSLAADVTTHELNVCGLSCPGPLIQVKQKMDGLTDGDQLHVLASDPGFYEDVKAWSQMSGHMLIQLDRGKGGTIEATLTKTPKEQTDASTSNQPAADPASTMVVFSGDLDKAIASFIIANGAAASGRKVTMFFTFWGLNILRKSEPMPVQKNMISRMFGMMMPRGSQRLGLSKMNMLGIGPKLIRGIMGNQNIASLEDLIRSASEQGVEMVACQMSMDVMGIQHEELIDGIKIAGVGYYLGQADRAGHNLFI
ncbi:FAD-dependent oxidoreductase [Paenibacillus wenxiniae]|uniref:FAD-dependent oxidoreductase n=1 Tax=Paenibacillus wenxiniae TaxID=1636843 RepID=A0ABW4RMX6_9BACL